MKIKYALLAVLLVLNLIPFASEAEEAVGTDISQTAEAAIEALDTSAMFTDRDKEIGYSDADVTKVSLSEINGAYTISAEGEYLISGTNENGMIIIDAGDSDKVRLILSDAKLVSESSAAIYVKNADKVFITLEGENILSTGGEYVNIDDNNIDAVVFSKDDIVFNGNGSLTINAPYGHAIVSKDDLKICGGTVKLQTENKALRANDSIRICSASIDIISTDDALHAENDDGNGYIYIESGKINIQSGDDAITADGAVYIYGGEINVAGSKEGIEGKTIDIYDGTINVVSSDDGLNARTKLQNTGSSFTKPTDAQVLPDEKPVDGSEQIQRPNKPTAYSYSGREGTARHNTNNGESSSANVGTDANSDANINNNTDTDSNAFTKGGMNKGMGGGFGGGFGGGGMQNQEGTYIAIHGGTVNVNASGDGLDSNGNIYISGGYTTVSGPVSNGDGALDYNGSAEITGGTIIACGSSGMLQSFGSNPSQGTIAYTFPQSNGELSLTDSNGKIIITYTPEKTYCSAVISSPKIISGETYTLKVGETEAQITMTSNSYTNAQGGGMAGARGMEAGGRTGGIRTGDGTGSRTSGMGTADKTGDMGGMRRERGF